LIRYADAQVEAINDNTCRVHVRSESRAWLITVVALLSTQFDVLIEHPADLRTDVKNLGVRLRAVSTRSAQPHG
jgi:hypothetical protein